MEKQVYNPYLPLYEYVPDGEPHIFGDRLYLYGSHDRFDGEMFCLNDYVCYSADIHDLHTWRYEGVIFCKEQDPRNQKNAKPDEIPFIYDTKGRFPGGLNAPGIHALWAPDVVQGRDGKYYLYYCLDFLPEIGVAVCDTPAGKYEFLGFVRHADERCLASARVILDSLTRVFLSMTMARFIFIPAMPRCTVSTSEENRPHRL